MTEGGLTRAGTVPGAACPCAWRSRVIDATAAVAPTCIANWRRLIRIAGSVDRSGRSGRSERSAVSGALNDPNDPNVPNDPNDLFHATRRGIPAGGGWQFLEVGTGQVGPSEVGGIVDLGGDRQPLVLVRQRV